MSETEPVRFGVLGAGRIALNAFVPAIGKASGASLHAVASRDPDRARSAKPTRAYGSYKELLDDDAVEAVYIATHNGLHRDLAIAAVERGKHVLCEKPLACSASEANEMFSAAETHDRLLVEAFMYRHHPQIAAAQSVVAAGTIGGVKVVEAAFSALFRADWDVRYNPAWGGGALLDLGCYCVNACRFFMASEPLGVEAFGAFHPDHEVDMSVHGVLDFGDGLAGIVSCGFDAAFRNRVLICGTEGTVTLPRAFASSNERTEMILTRDGQDATVRTFEAVDTFLLEIEDLVHSIREGRKPLLPANDGPRNMRVLDALLASARSRP